MVSWPCTWCQTTSFWHTSRKQTVLWSTLNSPQNVCLLVRITGCRPYHKFMQFQHCITIYIHINVSCSSCNYQHVLLLWTSNKLSTYHSRFAVFQRWFNYNSLSKPEHVIRQYWWAPWWGWYFFTWQQRHGSSLQ